MLTDDFIGSDVIHIPNFRLSYPLRKGGAAMLVTAHDFQPLLAPQLDMGHDATIGNKIWFEFVRLGMRRMLLSDYMICNSTLTRNDAVSLGFDSKRIFVSNHGIDERFRNGLKTKRDSKAFKVGYLGGFRARKNVSSAVRAFMSVKDKNCSFELWGKKSFEYPYIANIARRDDRIMFMGFAPESYLVDVYDTFDCFVFPSLYEGEGLPVLEAQARGLPVIIYKKAKIANEIRKYCMEAKDEAHMTQLIQKIKENGYNEKSMRKARAYARSFTWQKTAKGTFEAYKKIYKN